MDNLDHDPLHDEDELFGDESNDDDLGLADAIEHDADFDSDYDPSEYDDMDE